MEWSVQLNRMKSVNKSDKQRNLLPFMVCRKVVFKILKRVLDNVGVNPPNKFQRKVKIRNLRCAST